MIDQRSCTHNLSSCEIKAWKNIYIFKPTGAGHFAQSDQLPVGLIAQLVEHCTGIAEVMGSIPV